MQREPWTEGPWTAEVYSEQHPHYGIFARGNVILAKAWTPGDARLIAAAPDLAKALQYARNLIGPDEVIDAALTRARGEKNDAA